MLEVVSLFVTALVTHILDCYVFSKIISERFKFTILNIILIICITFIDYILGVSSNIFVKIAFTNLMTFLMLKFIYNKSIIKTMIGTLVIYLGFVLAESIFAILFFVILKLDQYLILKNIFGIILSNLIIFMFYILIFKCKFIHNVICNTFKWIDEKKILNLVSKIILAMVVCCILLYYISYYKVSIEFIMIIFVVLLCILTFIVGYLKEKSGNNKLTIEYAQLLDYVKTYEDEVVDKSKKQHEYKNQLVIIDDMIPKTNKKAKEYLKKVLNNVEDVTDNDWLVKLKNLPSGGIKGLVHFKIKKMLENKISVYIDVDKKLSKKDNLVNVEKNLEDISRILGVYLDNAIEAASRAKDRQIIIEFINREDSIEFILSNSYIGNICFDELDKEGYSTKGKNRGVGLSLVKDIIKNNKLLDQSREINGKFYVQKLYIKK